jgi:hypothetical protein
MGHTITSGNEVLVVAVARPRWGQIWAFCNDRGEIVVHRYLLERRGLARFRGDAVRAPDRLVHPDRLIGRVVKVRRGNREIDLRRSRHRLTGLFLSGVYVARAVFRAGRRAR